jgi:RNA polymerase sigma-70 factor (ECF subfamily)
VRKLVYESDFTEEESQRMERAEPGSEAQVPIDTALAQRDLVVKLLAKVSEEDRNLLLLKEVEGHSVEELAQMTGMNENTIKVKLFRARQKLVKAAQRLMPNLAGALFQ